MRAIVDYLVFYVYNVYKYIIASCAYAGANIQESFMTLLSATQNFYADIALFVLLALALIVGLIRGFSKSFKGFFLTIAIVLVSIFLISPTFTPVRNISVFGKMEQSITQSISKEDYMSMPVFVEVDEETTTLSYYVDVTQEDGSVQRVPLGDALGSDAISKTKAKFATWLAKQFIKEDGQTIGGVAGKFVSDLIVYAIIFIVYCIALGLICWLLRCVFKNMHTADSRALRYVDRLLGAIISVVLTALFLLVVLAILNAVGAKIPTVDEYLTNSPVCGYLYTHNPLTILWTKIFG